MKKVLSKLILLALFALVANAVQAQQGKSKKQPKDTVSTDNVIVKSNLKNIVGDYKCWDWYKRNGLTAPKNLDFNKYTILNYCYWTFKEDGTVIGVDEYADSILLRGEKDYVNPIQPAYVTNTSLIDLAHAAGVKVLVSIGGWTESPKFGAMVSNPASRAKFAGSVVEVIHRFGFDGVDIAWFHPGLKSRGGSDADKANFAQLMIAVRDSLDSYNKIMELKPSEKVIFTALFAPEDALTQHIDWEVAGKCLTYLNFQNWDMNLKGSEVVSHVAPLYKPSKGDTNAVVNAFNTLTQKYYIKAKKINLGISFTGTSILGKVGSKIDLFSTDHQHENDTVTFSVEQVPYWEIVSKRKLFDEKWDDVAKAPYMIGKTLNTFVSYDDVKSIQLKSQYILDKEVGGVMINDMCSDIIEKGEGSGTIDKTPLTDIVNETFQMKRKKPIEKRWKDYKKVAAAITEVPKDKDWRKNEVKAKFKGLYKKPVPKQ